MKEWLAHLRTFKPCADAWIWAQDFGTPQALWAACERPDWLLWLIGKTATDRRTIVTIAYAAYDAADAAYDAADTADAVRKQACAIIRTYYPRPPELRP